MKIKIFIFFIIPLCIASCMNNTSTFEIPEQEKIENKIIGKTALQLKKEKKIFPIGFGGSNIEGKEQLSMSFEYYEPLDIPQARKLIIYSAQLFLDKLTSSSELKEYLTKSYSMKNVEIIIFPSSPDSKNKKYDAIYVVDIVREKITYYEKKQGLSVLHQETYDEALKLLENE